MLALLAALLVAASACGEATSATRPCWKQVQDDWTDNGTIDKTYDARCYDEAIKKLPRDLFIYSDAPDTIAAAKQRAEKNLDRTLQGVGGSNNSGSGGSTGGGGTSSGPDAGPIGDVLNAGSTTTDGMPLPLLILGGVAILLLAAGAVGVTSRHVQARRTPPPE